MSPRYRPWGVDGPVEVSLVVRLADDSTALRVLDVRTARTYSRIGHFWAAWRAFERDDIDAVAFARRVRELGDILGATPEDRAERVTAVMELVAPEDLVFEDYSGDEAGR